MAGFSWLLHASFYLLNHLSLTGLQIPYIFENLMFDIGLVLMNYQQSDFFNILFS